MSAADLPALLAHIHATEGVAAVAAAIQAAGIDDEDLLCGFALLRKRARPPAGPDADPPPDDPPRRPHKAPRPAPLPEVLPPIMEPSRAARDRDSSPDDARAPRSPSPPALGSAAPSSPADQVVAAPESAGPPAAPPPRPAGHARPLPADAPRDADGPQAPPLDLEGSVSISNDGKPVKTVQFHHEAPSGHVWGQFSRGRPMVVEYDRELAPKFVAVRNQNLRKLEQPVFLQGGEVVLLHSKIDQSQRQVLMRPILLKLDGFAHGELTDVFVRSADPFMLARGDGWYQRVVQGEHGRLFLPNSPLFAAGRSYELVCQVKAGMYVTKFEVHSARRHKKDNNATVIKLSDALCEMSFTPFS